MKLKTDYTHKWLELGNAAADASKRMQVVGLEDQSKRLAQTASYCFMRYEQSTTRTFGQDRALIISYVGVTAFTLLLIFFIYILFI